MRTLEDLINKEVDGHQIGHPRDIPSEDYARMLARLVEEAFPTQVLAHLIEHGNKKLPDSDDLVRFFHNNPDFDLRETVVVSYLKKHGERALVGVEDKEDVTHKLKVIQRVYKITSHGSEILVLLEAGLQSASDIVQIKQAEFVAKYAMRLGGVERATNIYLMARNIESTEHNSSDSE